MRELAMAFAQPKNLCAQALTIAFLAIACWVCVHYSLRIESLLHPAVEEISVLAQRLDFGTQAWWYHAIQ